MKKFEQVSSNYHQMSLAGRGVTLPYPSGQYPYMLLFDVTTPHPPVNRQMPVKSLLFRKRFSQTFLSHELEPKVSTTYWKMSRGEQKIDDALLVIGRL